MTTRKTSDPTPAADDVAAEDAPALAQPATGGSFVRRPDGSLERVEFTAEQEG